MRFAAWLLWMTPLLTALSSRRLALTDAAVAAVASILANAPTKWFFATKDQSTTALMRVLIPGPPEPGPHIVDARPTALLKPGEAYWMMANASWGRGRARLDLLN